MYGNTNTITPWGQDYEEHTVNLHQLLNRHLMSKMNPQIRYRQPRQSIVKSRHKDHLNKIIKKNKHLVLNKDLRSQLYPQNITQINFNAFQSKKRNPSSSSVMKELILSSHSKNLIQIKTPIKYSSEDEKSAFKNNSLRGSQVGLLDQKIHLERDQKQSPPKQHKARKSLQKSIDQFLPKKIKTQTSVLNQMSQTFHRKKIGSKILDELEIQRKVFRMTNKNWVNQKMSFSMNRNSLEPDIVKRKKRNSTQTSNSKAISHNIIQSSGYYKRY